MKINTDLTFAPVYLIKLLFIYLLFCPFIQELHGQTNLTKPNRPLVNKIKSVDGFVALWKFNEKPGKEREASGKGKFPLKESVGKISRVNEGPLSGYSILLDGCNYLTLPHSQTGSLNIYGTGSEVTLIAWIKWTGEQTGFVGGMWNEYQDGGKRQYGLFISLPHYNGKDQVCGHISGTGKATAPFPYSIDYSASKQKVPKNEWCTAAFTYDGTYIKSYLNGVFEARDAELINNTTGFIGYPDGLFQTKNPYYFTDGIGNNGSDFTVGAVLLKSGMGNFFKGLIGGLAVFERALSENEIKSISGINDL
ncbi:MAG: LamG domain-containing protein [Bacteroidales bacterium]|nr:LamG domain-containing protein [Bacteroidales bacterium]